MKKNNTSQRDKGLSTVSKDLCLQKDSERFLFRYESGNEESVLDAFIDMANDPDSNFDWFDAAVLSFQLSKNLVAQADKLLCLDN